MKNNLFYHFISMIIYNQIRIKKSKKNSGMNNEEKI